MRFCLALLIALFLPFQTMAAVVAPKEATAVFAGGCFWSIQIPFDKTPGVIEAVVGYTGGKIAEPTYEQVLTGKTGHMEAVQVRYDPSKISYDQLLNIFWRNIDPVDPNGQFCDKGPQYRTAIFYGSPAEKQIANDSKMLLDADDERFAGKPITTQILPRAPFYAAEDYHQSYYRKNPLRYNFYRSRCGHDMRLKALWGKR